MNSRAAVRRRVCVRRLALHAPIAAGEVTHIVRLDGFVDARGQ